MRPPRRITRRDFLNGIALGAASLTARPAPARAAEIRPEEPYPPALTGLRGSHDGAFEVAHALKDGEFWQKAGQATDTGEAYDLVVVGAGISGLSAALFYRDALGPKARILLLDNHDDFGGHARRNEFRHGKRLLLSYGGSYAIESPRPYSAVAQKLIGRLGIDVSEGDRILDRSLYGSLSLSRGVYFDRETFGADRILPDPLADFGGESDDAPPAGHDAWPRFTNEAPWPAAAREEFERVCRRTADAFPELSDKQKKERLARLGYGEYLAKHVRAHPLVLKFLQARTHPLYGVGIDAVPALTAWSLGLPGFTGLSLTSAPGPGMDEHESLDHAEGERYFYHFPDGNASIARLIVRQLIPEAVPGKTAEDVVLARTRYGRLDSPSSPVRVRLESTVVKVEHAGDPATAREVVVSYSRGRKLETVRAARCVMACWNMAIPHLVPDLPEEQAEALADSVKVPLLYTNVLIRDWSTFQKAGFSAIHCPTQYHTTVNLGRPVSVGGHAASRAPEEPMVIHLVRTPCYPGLAPKQQHRNGRLELLQTGFADIEGRIREQLARMMGPSGFDAARDIEAITVNRWSHGYTYEYLTMWDPHVLAGGPAPCERARVRHGLVAIANADAGAYAYLDGAVDQAYRAVEELLAVKR